MHFAGTSSGGGILVFLQCRRASFVTCICMRYLFWAALNPVHPSFLQSEEITMVLRKEEKLWECLLFCQIKEGLYAFFIYFCSFLFYLMTPCSYFVFLKALVMNLVVVGPTRLHAEPHWCNLVLSLSLTFPPLSSMHSASHFYKKNQKLLIL